MPATIKLKGYHLDALKSVQLTHGDIQLSFPTDSPTASEAQFKITADEVNKHLPNDADYTTDKLDLVVNAISKSASKPVPTGQVISATGKFSTPAAAGGNGTTPPKTGSETKPGKKTKTQ